MHPAQPGLRRYLSDHGGSPVSANRDGMEHLSGSASGLRGGLPHVCGGMLRACCPHGALPYLRRCLSPLRGRLPEACRRLKQNLSPKLCRRPQDRTLSVSPAADLASRLSVPATRQSLSGITFSYFAAREVRRSAAILAHATGQRNAASRHRLIRVVALSVVDVMAQRRRCSAQIAFDHDSGLICRYLVVRCRRDLDT